QTQATSTSLNRVVGNLVVSMNAGRVWVGSMTGTLNVINRGGGITIDNAVGSLNVALNNGAIDMGAMAGNLNLAVAGRVKWNTANGNLTGWVNGDLDAGPLVGTMNLSVWGGTATINSVSALSTLNMTGGVLRLGSFKGGVSIFRTQLFPLTPYGAITVSSLNIMAGSTLNLQLGGNLSGVNMARLVVSDQLTVSGSLQLSFANGFTPTIGDKFDLIDFSSLSGQFSTVNIVGLPNGFSVDMSGMMRDGSLVFTAKDTDSDGVPDFLDAFPSDATKIVDINTIAPGLSGLSAGAKQNLQWWVMGDYNNSTLLEGNNVAVWYDLSGQQRHARQSLSVYRPQLSTIKGRNAIQFGLNGATHFLSVTSTNQLLLVTPSVFVVSQFDGVPTFPGMASVMGFSSSGLMAFSDPDSSMAFARWAFNVTDVSSNVSSTVNTRCGNLPSNTIVNMDSGYCVIQFVTVGSTSWQVPSWVT
ncbi:hypothetical protein EBZ35_08395, partial [bacterium]|nr:hypothetical protein [bacterium]